MRQNEMPDNKYNAFDRLHDEDFFCTIDSFCKWDTFFLGVTVVHSP
ncbi:MAG: hypothetical protein PVS3B1_24210 [Ktedonobacteraceae bacterium]